MNPLLNNDETPHLESFSTSGPASPLARVVEAGVRNTATGTLRLSKLLVAVDFASGSLQTLNYAAALAGRFGGRVSLLHVIERVRFLSGQGDVPPISDEKEAGHKAQERLGRWMRHRVAPAVQGELLMRRGLLVRQVVEAARSTHAGLLVFSRPQRRGWERFLAPSRLLRIVRQAPCPTLIVPENFLVRHWEATLGGRILVPVDGSAFSRSALKWGAALAEPTQGSLCVFYVPGLYERSSCTAAGTDHQLRSQTADALEQRLWAWAKETVLPALRVDALRDVGMRAAEVLALMATRQRCDLIVLCCRNASFRQRLLDGCLAEQLAGASSCPVLCLPEPIVDPFETAFDTDSRAGLNRCQPEPTPPEQLLQTMTVGIPVNATVSSPNSKP